MTRTQIIALLSELRLRPSRKLGQNFLVDANLLDAIARDAALNAGDHVLEVGSGAGILTRRLLEAGCRVTAVELDRRLVSYLQAQLGTEPNLRLIEGDACGLDYDAVMGDAPYRCVANLPYACSSVLIAKLTDARNPPTDMHLLLQREMGQRLAATPGTKNYSALTVRTQLLYEVCPLRSVPPEVFFPSPQVRSMFVRLRRHARFPADVRRRAADIARIAFSQRRKRLVKVLEPRFGRDLLLAACEHIGLSANARAENLSVACFAALCSFLTASEQATEGGRARA